MIYFYNTHEDIPDHIADYVMKCADVSDITKLSITDINAFPSGPFKFTSTLYSIILPLLNQTFQS